MDWQLGGLSPFSYIVGEHARAVIAIQNLQKEVSALLKFRENVFNTLPHLRDRASTTNTTVPDDTSSQPAPTSAVVDSGFSTDKASTSMGKSSSTSSSGGELSGGPRWDAPDTRIAGAFAEDCPEDELLHLLDLIQNKGTRLRKELQKAELQEREISAGSRRPTTDSWPHSLPPPPSASTHPYDPYSLEAAMGELERMRWDRNYLVSRVSRAEAEAAISHSRLVDLHSQLLALASEKRRLEDALQTYRPDALRLDGVPGSSRVHIDGSETPKNSRNRSNACVTVNVNQEPSEVVLPRVLKVPIRDRSSDKPSPRSRSQSTSSRESVKAADSHSSSTVPLHYFKSNPDRVVIERQRTSNKIDGGLSMPASLFKGAKIKVAPDKQRISAILREKDVLALQKQLLTTVMETDVLKKQLESCNEEWSVRSGQFETEQKRNAECIASLTQQNQALIKKLDSLELVERHDVGTQVRPSMKSVGLSTQEETDDPTFTVHEGPNVKYDVVVHQETPRLTRAIEKPPRKRLHPPRMGVSSVDATPKDTLMSPRLLKNATRTPTSGPSGTPRSSPASSLTTRNGRPKTSPSSMGRTNSKVSSVMSHLRASSGIPSLSGRRLSLSPDSSSSTYSRVRRRDLDHAELTATSLVRHPVSSRHLPKSPVKLVGEKASYSGSSIPVSTRSWRPLPDASEDELDRSDSSADELNAVKSAERKQKALWRKSSGAVRLRTVGRPSVLSYISPDALL